LGKIERGEKNVERKGGGEVRKEKRGKGSCNKGRPSALRENPLHNCVHEKREVTRRGE